MEDRFDFERLNDLIQEVQAFIRYEAVEHPDDVLDKGNLLRRMYQRCNEAAQHDS